MKKLNSSEIELIHSSGRSDLIKRVLYSLFHVLFTFSLHINPSDKRRFGVFRTKIPFLCERKKIRDVLKLIKSDYQFHFFFVRKKKNGSIIN